MFWPMKFVLISWLGWILVSNLQSDESFKLWEYTASSEKLSVATTDMVLIKQLPATMTLRSKDDSMDQMMIKVVEDEENQVWLISFVSINSNGDRL